jgi:hypothetical protein
MVEEVTKEDIPQTLEKEEQQFSFLFKESEVNLLLKALGDLPTKETFHLVSKIFATVGQQKPPS